MSTRVASVSPGTAALLRADGILAWIIRPLVLLARFSPSPPRYKTDGVLDGLRSHTFAFAVPRARMMKRVLR